MTVETGIAVNRGSTAFESAHWKLTKKVIISVATWDIPAGYWSVQNQFWVDFHRKNFSKLPQKHKTHESFLRKINLLYGMFMLNGSSLPSYTETNTTTVQHTAQTSRIYSWKYATLHSLILPFWAFTCVYLRVTSTTYSHNKLLNNFIFLQILLLYLLVHIHKPEMLGEND